MADKIFSHLKHSLGRIPAFVALSILTGCQLLRPYQGPIAPTPLEWKGSYSAPDAGVPAIPPTWKEDVQELPESRIVKEQSLKEPANENGETEQVNSSEDPHSEESAHEQQTQQEPSFDDVYRDLGNWWEIFQDPILNELEEQALNSSYTLWAALERVIEARATARINFAPLMPTVNLAPSINRTGSLIQSAIPTVGTGAGTGSAATSCPNAVNPAAAAAASALANAFQSFPRDFRFVQSQYLVPLNFSYEIDLWSQLNNAYYASLMRAQASSQAYLSVMLSLTADVASSYFQLRGLDSQQEVIRRNIIVRKNAFDINKARFNAGLIVYVDVSRAEVQLARAYSDDDDVRRMRGLQENVLATLVGVPASVFSLDPNPIFVPPPVVPTGLPSELLCRRPDIAEAERNLAAAYRDIGVAYANFFPSLTLNAGLGVESPFPHQLFSWKSRYWTVGLDILQNVFDGGRNQANLDYYRARFSEAMANYQETVLQSFKDVEDSLVNLRWYAKQAEDLADAVKASRTTLELSQMRYARGLVNYLDVVDAERDLLQAEQNSVIVLGDRYVSTVMLIKALGGGWGPCGDASGCDDSCEPE